MGERAIAYLDPAATAPITQVALDRMIRFETEERSNVHRGMHVLAERATIAYEDARETVKTFLNAAHADEIIFTKNCTEAINLVARSYGRAHVHEGDVILISELEHHSNIVPWLQLSEETGCEIRWIGMNDHGHLDMPSAEAAFKAGNVKLLAISAQSNVLGTRPPLNTLTDLAHKHGAVVLIDAAQSVAHEPTDVRALDCDFLAFSGHKLYGPTGIGVLYGKRDVLNSMPPFLGGGMMIGEVHHDRFTAADVPAKFEAGTPPIAQAVGLAASITWLSQFTWKDIAAHERSLIEAVCTMLSSIPKLHILGPTNFKDAHGCVSFVIEGIHPHDLTEILGRQGICLRAGHHCAQPLHRRLNVDASTRLSVGIFNTVDEITAIGPALQEAVKRLQQ